MSRNYRNSNNGGRNKSRANFLWIIIAAVLACSILASVFTMALGFMTENFTKKDPTTWFEQELNEDNLIKVENYNEDLPDDSDKGLKMKWKDNGRIVLSGKHDDSKLTDKDVYEYAFVSVELDAGTYIISTGNDSCDIDTFGLSYKYNTATGQTSDFVGNEDKKIVINEDNTVVTISVFARNELRLFGIQSYVDPILVPDGAEISFYK